MLVFLAFSKWCCFSWKQRSVSSPSGRSSLGSTFQVFLLSWGFTAAVKPTICQPAAVFSYLHRGNCIVMVMLRLWSISKPCKLNKALFAVKIFPGFSSYIRMNFIYVFILLSYLTFRPVFLSLYPSQALLPLPQTYCASHFLSEKRWLPRDVSWMQHNEQD